ncbi:MAG: hypothetical protein WDW38_008981 [Sanguina aurantia]
MRIARHSLNCAPCRVGAVREELTHQAGKPAPLAHSPAASVGSPQAGGHHLPHLEHHAHFGWNPPLPGGGQKPGHSQSTALKYGQALQFNQDVTPKMQLLSTRHV